MRIVLITTLVDFSFETENGIKVEESGVQKQVGATPEETGTVAKGSFSYPAPDGTIIKVDWIADENGFQPKGDHIPPYFSQASASAQ